MSHAVPSGRLCAPIAVFACLVLGAAACGRKGPPLPPLHLVPDGPSDVGARRVPGEIRVRFVLPTKNANGTGTVELDRVEIYAMTIPAGMPPPANRELLTSRFVVGTVQVKPPPVEGEPPPEHPPEHPEADKRPSPGETVTFVEKLTDDKLKPTPRPGLAKEAASAKPPVLVPLGPVLPGVVVPAPVLPGTATAPAAPAPPPPPVTVPYAVRVYSIRGLTKSGRPGSPSPRVQVPLVDLPAPPTTVAAKPTETALVITWAAPGAAPGTPALAYNVYGDEAGAPLNPQPLAAPTFERPGASFGTEQCFTIRSVAQFGTVSIESESSARECITPRDTFPPSAPKGLSAVADAGVINLIWEPNTEADLDGYHVLRGEAPGDTLRQITTTAVHETSYSDKTVTPGVRYTYVVVAVDKGSPPNMSPQSPRYSVTAR